MISINVPQCYVVTKNYDIKITKYKGTEYKGDTQWIAEWYYTVYEPFMDNVIFHIRGDFHETYPNPPHLSIKIEYPDNTLSNWLHLSIDKDGKGYIQNFNIAGKKNKSKKRKKRKKRKSILKKLHKEKTRKRVKKNKE